MHRLFTNKKITYITKKSLYVTLFLYSQATNKSNACHTQSWNVRVTTLSDDTTRRLGGFWAFCVRLLCRVCRFCFRIYSLCRRHVINYFVYTVSRIVHPRVFRTFYVSATESFSVLSWRNGETHVGPSSTEVVSRAWDSGATKHLCRTILPEDGNLVFCFEKQKVDKFQKSFKRLPQVSQLWRSDGDCLVKWSQELCQRSVATGRVSHARSKMTLTKRNNLLVKVGGWAWG
jgi:hypothetical protein